MNWNHCLKGVFAKKRQGEMEKESSKINQILSMKGGLGEESYAKNSKPQVSSNFSFSCCVNHIQHWATPEK